MKNCCNAVDGTFNDAVNIMRIAIISDIHGNATAFERVLADIETCGTNHVFCLGDNVGYGPEPETVVNMLRQHDIASVMGNHELAVSNPEFLAWFNPAARLSLEKTMDMISSENLNYLSALPGFMTAFNCRFVHGFPPDSITKYLFEIHPVEMETIMAEMVEPLCFIGHTHELTALVYQNESVDMNPLRRHMRLDPACKYIINAGSVGQPRDGSSEAKYVIYDDREHSLEVRYVPYDVNDTIDKIYAANLPKQHALRLLWV